MIPFECPTCGILFCGDDPEHPQVLRPRLEPLADVDVKVGMCFENPHMRATIKALDEDQHGPYAVLQVEAGAGLDFARYIQRLPIPELLRPSYWLVPPRASGDRA